MRKVELLPVKTTAAPVPAVPESLEWYYEMYDSTDTISIDNIQNWIHRRVGRGEVIVPPSYQQIEDKRLAQFIQFIDGINIQPVLRTCRNEFSDRLIQAMIDYNTAVEWDFITSDWMSPKVLTDRDNNEHIEGQIRQIKQLLEEGLEVRARLHLHQNNLGSGEGEQIVSLIDRLNSLGIDGQAVPIRANARSELVPTADQLKNFYNRLFQWFKQDDENEWDPVSGIRDSLLSERYPECSFASCGDGVCSSHVFLLPDGEAIVTCPSVWGGDKREHSTMDVLEDVNWLNPSYRDEELCSIPGKMTGEGDDDVPDMGGCRDCRFWNICHGGCPATGINGLETRRTKWCDAYYSLFEQIERSLQVALPDGILVTDYPPDVHIDPLIAVSEWGIDSMKFYRGAKATGMGTETGAVTILLSALPDEYIPHIPTSEQVSLFESHLPDDAIRVSNNGLVHGDLHVLNDPDPDEVTKWDELNEEFDEPETELHVLGKNSEFETAEEEEAEEAEAED